MSNSPLESDRTDSDRTRYKDLAASRKLVLAAIEADGDETSWSRLAERTLLAESTIHRTLQDLRLRGLVERSESDVDGRRTVYSVNENTPPFWKLPP